jgi:hypothetical protein
LIAEVRLYCIKRFACAAESSEEKILSYLFSVHDVHCALHFDVNHYSQSMVGSLLKQGALGKVISRLRVIILPSVGS